MVVDQAQAAVGAVTAHHVDRRRPADARHAGCARAATIRVCWSGTRASRSSPGCPWATRCCDASRCSSSRVPSFASATRPRRNSRRVSEPFTRALVCVPAARRARPRHRRRVARLPPPARLRRRRADVPHRARASRRPGAGARDPLRTREAGAPSDWRACKQLTVGAVVRGDGRGGRPLADPRRRRGARARRRGPFGPPTSKAIFACSARTEPASDSSRAFRHIPLTPTCRPPASPASPAPVWARKRGDLAIGAPEPSSTAMGRGNAFRAYGALPLVREDHLLGVLAFSAGRPRRFSLEERAFMSTVAEHCADALARARLYDDARRDEAPPAERARTAARRDLRFAPAGQHARLGERRGRPHLAGRRLPGARGGPLQDAEGDVPRRPSRYRRRIAGRSGAARRGRRTRLEARIERQDGTPRLGSGQRRARASGTTAPSKSRSPRSST